MTRLFPDARDYRTVSVPVSPGALERIEARVGSPILPGQREQYQYFEMLDAKGGIIGYTEAVTQKGEFGAIEVVFGLDKEFSIIGLYVQRSRERNNQFKDKAFLQNFVGKRVTDAQSVSDPLGKEGNTGTRALATGIKKALVSFDELVLKK
jgi:Na+-translocating ferredoxin:NAD+ oxidoreductase RnfG subunit